MADVANRRVGTLTVCLVHHEDVTDLQNPGLGSLDAIAHSGCEEHQGGIGQPGHLDLALAHPDGLDHDGVTASRIQDAQRLRSRPRQATEVTPTGHRADVDLWVERMVLHADPVTQQGATGERR